MLFDTHCHLTHPPLCAKLPEILAEAEAAGVTRFLVPGTTPQDWQNILVLAQQHPNIQATCGLHPWWAEHYSGQNLAVALTALEQVLHQHAALCIGEIGLDFFRARTADARQQQTALFETQLALAQQHRRAVVIHNVHASSACWQSIKRSGFRCGGIVHAFSGSCEEAQQWIKHGFKIGIGVAILRDNADKLRRTAAALPLEHIVLETDAPYLLPPHRNRPALIHTIAATLATLHHRSFEEIARITTQNACAVLALPS